MVVVDTLGEEGIPETIYFEKDEHDTVAANLELDFLEETDKEVFPGQTLTNSSDMTQEPFDEAVFNRALENIFYDAGYDDEATLAMAEKQRFLLGTIQHEPDPQRLMLLHEALMDVTARFGARG